MTYGRYIKEHISWLIIFSCLFVSIEIFLLTFAHSGWLMIYVAIALWVGFFVGTYLEFWHWKRYLLELELQLQGLEPKYLLSTLMDKGTTKEQQKLKEIFYQMEVSMNEAVSEHRRNSLEYKEYIETWVHEIKMPIAAMKMILANHTEADYGMSDELSRMEGYVEQALFYARSNDVEKDYLIKEVNLQQVVQNVILKRKKMLRGMNAKIQLQNLDAIIYSDGKWLEFMLGQVLDNSIKYGEKNKLWIEVSSEKKENTVLLHIQDNGMGMKNTEVSRAFEKGFTGSNGRGNANSTGIGLYLCKKLCTRLEHNISITSKEGEGTTVTFHFPLSNMMTMNE